MARETIAQFLEALDQREDLRKDLTSALEGLEDQTPAIVDVAGRHGYEFTEDEFNVVLELIAAEQAQQLSDEELEGVAGGSGRTGPPPPASIKQYNNFSMNFSGRRATLLIR